MSGDRSDYEGEDAPVDGGLIVNEPLIGPWHVLLIIAGVVAVYATMAVVVHLIPNEWLMIDGHILGILKVR